MKTPLSKRLVQYPLYTVGDLSTGIYAVTPSILLMFYMTNVLGISVGIATLAAAFPKIIDLISSPIVGGMSDRTTTRLGRRRPYLLFAGLTILPAFGVIWAAPFRDPVLSASFVVVVFSVCTFCYSAFLIPYCALNSELATDYHDGTTLNSYRAAYSLSGALLAGAGAPLIVEHFNGGRQGYLVMGATMGAIMAVSILVTFAASKEPVRHTEMPRFSKAEIWHSLTNNRPFLLLLVSYFLHVVSSGVISAALAYFVTYILHRDTDTLSLVFFLSFGASVVSIPFFVWLGKRAGKFWAFFFALILTAVTTMGWLILDQSVPLAFALLIATVSGLSEGGIQVFAYSMLSDCIKFGDTRTNAARPEAILSGVFVAGEKLGFAVGAVAAGGIFSLTGLLETSEGFIEQPPSAIMGIRIAASLFPAILNVVAIAAFWSYRAFDSRIASDSALAEFHVEQTAIL